MKVLVIGGAGYIGGHVVKELMKHGHSVTVFDNLQTGLRQNLFPENEFIYGNILNSSDLDSAFEKGFDAFFHMAALKAAGDSMLYPEKYSVHNLTGSINILNSAIKHNCKMMVFSSTAAIFGEPSYLPIDENHPKQPENYYGFTKLELEKIMDWYSKIKGLKFVALRYFNAAGYDIDGELYGLEQSPANLLPVIMETAVGKRKLMKIFGNDYDTPDGTCIRDYVHVTDLATAHVKALEYLSKNSDNLKLNLGSENGISVLQMIEAARRITGKEIPAEITNRRAGDPSNLYATSKLAHEKLNWYARYSDIDTLISSTWKAYKRNYGIE